MMKNDYLLGCTVYMSLSLSTFSVPPAACSSTLALVPWFSLILISFLKCGALMGLLRLTLANRKFFLLLLLALLRFRYLGHTNGQLKFVSQMYYTFLLLGLVSASSAFTACISMVMEQILIILQDM
jgi:hypothetical protein